MNSKPLTQIENEWKRVEISESENTASKMFLNLAFKNGNVQWLGEPPKKYNSPLLGQPLLKMKIS